MRQTNEQISHEAMQNYYDNGSYGWKVVKMEQQTDSKETDSEIAAEYTDGNNTSTNSHENTPHRNVDCLVNFILSFFPSFCFCLYK